VKNYTSKTFLKNDFQLCLEAFRIEVKSRAIQPVEEALAIWKEAQLWLNSHFKIFTNFNENTCGRRVT
jgi:hypothetical protein